MGSRKLATKLIRDTIPRKTTVNNFIQLHNSVYLPIYFEGEVCFNEESPPINSWKPSTFTGGALTAPVFLHERTGFVTSFTCAGKNKDNSPSQSMLTVIASVVSAWKLAASFD